MDICIITGIFPPDIGGPATYVSRLADSLQQQNFSVRVLTLGDDAAAFPFPVKRVSRALPLPLRLFLLFWTFLRHGWSSDVWYINGLEFPAVLAGKLLRKRMVMKVVGDYAWERAMNAHLTQDSIDEFQKKTQARKVEVHKALRAWCAKQVERIVTPSNYLKSLVCGWGIPEERVHVIYNAVEELPGRLRTRSEVRKQLGVSEDETLLITVGRLVKWKGIEQLLLIVSELEPSVKLLIVGSGPEKNKLTELVETLNLASRIRFLGKAPRKEVLEFVQSADLFLLNTAYEGFSHVLLEAMMVGTPVITTDVCGNPELVHHQENGLLITPGDSEELKQQILRMLDDTHLQKQCRENGALVIRQYPWEQLLKETIRILTAP